jgi:hypothetical protein
VAICCTKSLRAIMGLRARVVLASTQDETVQALASQLKISPNTSLLVGGAIVRAG